MAGNSSWHGCTNFENATHQSLYGMVADGDHMEIGYKGACLADAGKEIERIATELKAHIEQVQWEGEGAEAFREWGHDTVKESHKLAQFATNTGDALTDAAGALGSAKLMPAPKQGNFVELDGAAPAARSATDALIMKDPERDEAVAAMNRLASYYRTAQAKIESQEPPNFRPASGFVPSPAGWGEGVGTNYVLDQSSNSGSVSAAGAPAATSAWSNSSGEQHAGGHRSVTPAAGHQDQHVGMAVNATAPVITPDTMPSQGNAIPTNPGISGNPTNPVVPGPHAIPGTVKAPTERGKTTRAPQPDTARSGMVQERSRSAMREGIVGTTAQRDTAAGRPRLPGGTVMGEEHGVSPSRPVVSGGNPPASGSGTTGEGTGSSGKRLASHRGEMMDRPRGLVMGEERGSMARGIPGGGHPGSASSSVSHGGPGRRWAYEPGGTVGAGTGGPVMGGEQHRGVHGSASEQGGTGSRAQTSRGVAGDFTSGGTGLARGNPSSATHVVPGVPSSSRGRRSSAQRPDYLQEDDETWTTQHRPVMPPVIE
ncbi:WXG100 family type VII secretion target [Streptomyces sp. NPDC001339]|uniref:WXG100 family type VII secretion target n=1 Tax=Streptomyces sp. NPDC001339 TaxID=3364563 RepID=UPI0036B1E016